MKDLTNLKSDFRDWLTLPMTKTFTEILSKQREVFLAYANRTTFNSYHEKKVNKSATLHYGKVDGIDTVLSLMDECKNDKPKTSTIDGQEVVTYPTIDELFNQVFNIENE